jgi:hypothetical protein
VRAFFINARAASMCSCPLTGLVMMPPCCHDLIIHVFNANWNYTDL